MAAPLIKPGSKSSGTSTPFGQYTPPKKKSSGPGRHFWDVPENFVVGAKNAAYGLPGALKQSASMISPNLAYLDDLLSRIPGNPIPDTKPLSAKDKKKVEDYYGAILRGYQKKYGSALRGDFGDIFADPLGTTLDVTTLLSLGSSAGVRTGLLAGPKGYLLHPPGAAEALHVPARGNILRGYLSQAADAGLKGITKETTRGVGEYARAARTQRLRSLREMKAQQFESSKLNQMLSKMRKPEERTAAYLLATLPDENLISAEIRRLESAPVDHPHYAAMTAKAKIYRDAFPIVGRTLADIRNGVDSTGPQMRVRALQPEMLHLSQRAREISGSQVSGIAAAERPYLPIRLATGGKFVPDTSRYAKLEDQLVAIRDTPSGEVLVADVLPDGRLLPGKSGHPKWREADPANLQDVTVEDIPYMIRDTLPQRIEGGMSIPEIQAHLQAKGHPLPMYMPEMQDLSAPRMIGGGGGGALQQVPGSTKRNMGVLREMGRIIEDPSALTASFLRRVRYAHYTDLYNSALESAEWHDKNAPIPKGYQPLPLPAAPVQVTLDGKLYTAGKSPERISGLVRTTGEFYEWVQKTLGDNPERRQAQNTLTDLFGEEKAKAVVSVMDRLAEASGDAPKWYQDRIAAFTRGDAESFMATLKNDAYFQTGPGLRTGLTETPGDLRQKITPDEIPDALKQVQGDTAIYAKIDGDLHSVTRRGPERFEIWNIDKGETAGTFTPDEIQRSLQGADGLVLSNKGSLGAFDPPVYYSQLQRNVDKLDGPLTKEEMDKEMRKQVRSDEWDQMGMGDFFAEYEDGAIIPKQDLQHFLGDPLNAYNLNETVYTSGMRNLEDRSLYDTYGKEGMLIARTPSKDQPYHELVMELNGPHPRTPGVNRAASHWGEKSYDTGREHQNIVVSIRFHQIVDNEGKKALLIDEIQSDWASDYRKRLKAGTDPWSKKDPKVISDYERQIREHGDEMDRHLPEVTQQDVYRARDEYQTAQRKLEEAQTRGGDPADWDVLARERDTALDLLQKLDEDHQYWKNGPEGKAYRDASYKKQDAQVALRNYRRSTENPPPPLPKYTDAAVRRLMRWAADSGHHRIIVAPPEVQAYRNASYHTTPKGRDGDMQDYEWEARDEAAQRWREDVADMTHEELAAWGRDNLELGGRGWQQIYGVEVPGSLEKNIGAKGEWKDGIYDGYFADQVDAIPSYGDQPIRGFTIDLGDKGLQKAKAPQSLFQQLPWENLPRGATELLGNSGKTAIRLFEGADIDTVLEEVAHAAIWDLDPEVQKVFEGHFGAGKALKDWDRASHEAYARGFVQYHRTGSAATAVLTSAFKKVSAWLQDVTRTAKEKKLPPEVIAAFDRMHGAHHSNLPEQDLTNFGAGPGETDTRVSAPLAETFTDKPSVSSALTPADLFDENGIPVARDKGMIAIVPKNYIRSLRGEFTRTSDFAYNMQKYPLAVWRALVLYTRPAWLVNNIVGNSLLWALSNADAAGMRSLWAGVRERFDKTERAKMDALMAQRYPEQSHGTFGETQIPEYTSTKAGKARAAVRGAQWLPHKMRDIDIKYEQILRRRGVRAELERHPELFQRVHEMRGETKDFLTLADEASANPEVADRISQRVNDALGDYTSMTDFEKRYLRTAFPFYAWLKAMTLIALKLPLDQPIKMNILAQLGQMSIEQNMDELEGVPDWLSGALPIGPMSNGRLPVITTAMNPFTTPVDVGKFAYALGSVKPGLIGASLPGIAPQYEGLYEAISGNDIKTGYPVRGQGGLVGAGVNIVKGLPPYRLGEVLLGKNYKGKPGSPTLYDKAKIDEMLRYFGVPYANLSVEQAQKMQKQWEERFGK